MIKFTIVDEEPELAKENRAKQQEYIDRATLRQQASKTYLQVREKIIADLRALVEGYYKKALPEDVCPACLTVCGGDSFMWDPREGKDASL